MLYFLCWAMAVRREVDDNQVCFPTTIFPFHHPPAASLLLGLLLTYVTVFLVLAADWCGHSLSNFPRGKKDTEEYNKIEHIWWGKCCKNGGVTKTRSKPLIHKIKNKITPTGNTNIKVRKCVVKISFCNPVPSAWCTTSQKTGQGKF